PLTARAVARAHRHEKTPALVLGFGRGRVGRRLGGLVLAGFLRGLALGGFLTRGLLARAALLRRRLRAFGRLANADPSPRDLGHRVLDLLGPDEEARFGEADQD